MAAGTRSEPGSDRQEKTKGRSAELMGIRSEKVLRRYTHFSVDSLRDIVADLDRKRIEKKAGGRTDEAWLLQCCRRVSGHGW